VAALAPRGPSAAASSHKARKIAATPPFLGRNTLLTSSTATFSSPLPSRLNVSSGNQQPSESNNPNPKLPGDTTFGEDSAAFDLSKQTLKDWTLFFTLLTVVMGALYAVWIAPNGFGIGAEFVSSLESLLDSSEATVLGILFVFAIAHSGLAYLRPYGEEFIGARAYRVIFALVSLPLATAAVVYFINHRYDGIPLWNLR
jgi:zeta-carotene isomerase